MTVTGELLRIRQYNARGQCVCEQTIIERWAIPQARVDLRTEIIHRIGAERDSASPDPAAEA